MKALRVVICISIFFGASSFSTAESPDDDGDKVPAIPMLLPQHHLSDASGPPLALDEVERMALAENPEIRVAARRVAIVDAHLPSAGALDDPSFMYRGWQVPL